MSETETLTQEEGTQEGVTGGFNLTSVLASRSVYRRPRKSDYKVRRRR